MNKLSVTIAIALAVLCVATIYYNWHPTSTNIDELELVEETIEITKPKLPPPADLNSPAVKTLGTHTSDNSNPKVAKYLSVSAAAQQEGIGILESKNGWLIDKGESCKTGLIHSKKIKKWGTVHKFEGCMTGISSKVLFYDMIRNSETAPTWNPTIKEVKIIKPLNNNTDISYSVSASAGGGFIASRDFVIVRHWEEIDGWYLMSSVSVEYETLPPKPGYVRGEQGPNIMRMRDSGANTLTFQWLFITDVKGYIPASILNKALAGTLITYFDNLRQHAITLV
ncbi:hypothetical protein EB796_001812 [Bugula neritina]|uniref:START domain-containing protein n=1 Tax=Bugula neritina TaxID=10212 RepID=A0A7J7KNY3_BUGNE|nr:hypothetical protein EB796_001812 [Bugula neritina]